MDSNFTTINDYLCRNADEYPERVVIQHLDDGERAGASYTLAQLRSRCQAWAPKLLAENRNGKQGRIVVLIDAGDTLSTMGGVFSSFWAGLGVVPVPKAYSVEQVLTIARTCQNAVIAGDAASVAPFRACGEFPIAVLDDSTPSQGLMLEPRPCLPDELALVFYTSGSTSSPRGVRITHSNLMSCIEGWNHSLGLTPQDIGICWTPLYHSAALTAMALAPFCANCKVFYISPYDFRADPSRWLKAISNHRGSFSVAPNAIFDLCVKCFDDQAAQALDLSCWRIAINSTEPVRERTLQRFVDKFSCAGFVPGIMFPAWGLSEATCAATVGPLAIVGVDRDSLNNGRVVPGDYKLLGSGQPIGDMRLTIVDPATCEPCAEDRVGEVWLTGSQVSPGYLNVSEEQQACFNGYLSSDIEHKQRHLRTGDLGFIRDNNVFICGRLKEVVLVCGRVLYPNDLEISAERCSELFVPGRGAAFSVDIDDEERLVFFWEIEDPEAVKQHGAEALQKLRYAISRDYGVGLYDLVFCPLGSIPRTAGLGKLQRSKCAKLYLNGEVKRYEISRPKTSSQASGAKDSQAIEKLIANWLSKRIAIDTEIDVERSFAEQGLGSIAMAELAAHISKHVERTVQPADLWAYPTARSLAQALCGNYLELPTSSARPSAAASDEPIAIVGIGCRYSGNISDPDSMWQFLSEGGCAAEPMPLERRMLAWDDAASDDELYGHYLRNGQGFDAEFFGIKATEAVSMDPQQRLALMVAWEALENAGIAADSLAGSNTSVYMGVIHGDYTLMCYKRNFFNAWSTTGVECGAVAGRISHSLGSIGQALSIDTACSSSLAAIHLAVNSLRSGQSTLALAGGVNLNFSVPYIKMMHDSGLCSEDGRVKAFDSEADGFGLGEGCGVLVLKCLSDAQRDGDRIWAVIKGTALNQDGRSSLFTSPSMLSQAGVMWEALRSSGLEADDIGYLEAHGTGTLVGDPVELKAVSLVYAAKRSQPLVVGSVKANLGHCTAASGVASAIKAALCLHHQQIVPSVNVNKLSGLADWTNLEVSRQLHPWVQTNQGPRRAAVSSFGIVGTNAHLIFEEASSLETSGKTSGSLVEAINPQASGDKTRAKSHLFVLSAATSQALHEYAQAIVSYLASPEGCSLALADVCSYFGVKRSQLKVRLAYVVDSLDQLRQLLATFVQLGQYPNPLEPAYWLDEAKAAKLLKKLSIISLPNEILREFSEAAPANRAQAVRNLAVNPDIVNVVLDALAESHQDDSLLGLAAASFVGGQRLDYRAFAKSTWTSEHVPHYPWQYKSYWYPLDPGPDCYLGLEWAQLEPFEMSEGICAKQQWLVGGPSATSEFFREALLSCGQQLLEPEDLVGSLGALDSGHPLNVAYVAGQRDLEPEFLGFKRCLEMAQRLGQARLWLITQQSGQAAGLNQSTRANSTQELLTARHQATQAALWGLARTIKTEYPQLQCRCFDVGDLGNLRFALKAFLAQNSPLAGEDEVALSQGCLYVNRLVQRTITLLETEHVHQEACPLPMARVSVKPSYSSAKPISSEAQYLITGGTGGLGLELAAYLVRRGARHLVLVSRRGVVEPSQQEALERLQANGAQVSVEKLDLADYAEVQQLFARIDQLKLPLRGVFHAAGQYAISLLSEMTSEQLQQNIAAKAYGAWNLHLATRQLELDYFVIYSSVAGVLASPGQAAYAAANAFLDGLARIRHSQGLPASAVAWSTFTDTGMISSQLSRAERLAASGLGMQTAVRGTTMLEPILAARPAHVIAATLDVQLWLSYYPQWQHTSLFKGIVPSNVASGQVSEPAVTAFSRYVDCAGIREAASSILGEALDESHDKIALSELGYDSLMAVELRNLLQKRYGIALPVTLVFEHPTIVRLCNHLQELIGPDSLEPVRTASNKSTDIELAQGVAIVGIGLRAPGELENPQALWEFLANEGDAVAPAPSSRPGLGQAPGGYLSKITWFDAERFGMSQAEAANTDPQQRLLLEVSCHALEDAAIAPDTLEGSNTGVFVGLCNNDFAEMVHQNRAFSAWSGTGIQTSAVAGRVSYWLGAEGPSMVVDTACSSSLLAVHLACQSLQKGECDLALAGGVNLVLSDKGLVMLSQLGASSSSGRCRSFSAQADGFVRGEGCAVVVLKPYAQAVRDGNRVYAVIRGSAVTQDGRSNGFSAPSGQAQEKAMRLALEAAQIGPAQVQYLEAHGSATVLGDPLELRASQAVFGNSHSPNEPLLVGCVKTNFGHQEAAAGIFGLVKATLALAHGQIPASLHCSKPTELFDWQNMQVVSKLRSWPGKATAKQRYAGVSAFGLSGTNVHVIIGGIAGPELGKGWPKLTTFNKAKLWPATMPLVETDEPVSEDFHQLKLGASELSTAAPRADSVAAPKPRANCELFSVDWQPVDPAAGQLSDVAPLKCLIQSQDQLLVELIEQELGPSLRFPWQATVAVEQLRQAQQDGCQAVILGPDLSLEGQEPFSSRVLSWLQTIVALDTYGEVGDKSFAHVFILTGQTGSNNWSDQSCRVIDNGSVWGLVRTFMQEHPHIHISLVSYEQPARFSVLQALHHCLVSQQRQIAVTRQQLYQLAMVGPTDIGSLAQTERNSAFPGISASEAAESTSQNSSRTRNFAADSLLAECASLDLPSEVVLLTGGLGALGSHVCRSLVNLGARHLVLWQHSALTPRQADLITKLKEHKVQIYLIAAAAPNELFAKLDQAHLQPTVVLHLAGILDDALIPDLNHQRLQASVDAKTCFLGELVNQSWFGSLRYFVAFSAVVSVFGSAGQANYTAANAALDAWTHWAQSHKVPTLTLDWGPWTEGMDERRSAVSRARLHRMGVFELPTNLAITAFETLFGYCGRFVVSAIDWQECARWLPAALTSPLPVKLLGERSGADLALAQSPCSATSMPRDTSTVAGRLAETESIKLRLTDGPNSIEDLVSTAFVRVAGRMLEPNERNSSFGDLGFDSLMSIEMRNQLGSMLSLSLPATIAFDYPSPSQLAQCLRDLLDRNDRLTACPEKASQITTTAEMLVPSSSSVVPSRGPGELESIAVIGMACRLPAGCDSPEQLWQVLVNQVDVIGPVPAERLEVGCSGADIPTRHGGYISQGLAFDPEFFGISPREARSLDPQQRIMLEVCWQALENSLIPPNSLAGSNTGVYMGVCTSDYANLLRDAGQTDAWTITGVAPSAGAGRVAYTLGLEGPTMTLDTACSSSLLAVHTACQALRNRECSLALAGGVNMMLDAHTTANLAKLQALSPTSRCRVFDEAADGYVRSEGCAVVVLKLASQAQADGDRVLALIPGSAVGQDGRSHGFTVPRGPAQEKVMRRALQAAGMEPSEVTYVEAHGVGTQISDPMELQSVNRVYGGSRACWIGALKSNIGHTEACAGAAALVKAVLMLNKRQIPPNLHFEVPTSQLDWNSLALTVAAKSTKPWHSDPKQQRAAGLDAFGISGTNVHLLVQESPANRSTVFEQPHGCLALMLGADSPAELTELVLPVAEKLKMLSPAGAQAWANLASMAQSGGRYHLSGVLEGSPSLLAENLRTGVAAYAAKGQAASLPAGINIGMVPELNEPQNVVFLFTGQGSHYAGMAAGLYKRYSVFRECFDECASLLTELIEVDLAELVWGAQTALLEQTKFAQIAIFCVEICLYRLWRSWGVLPSYLFGHSLGEVSAACAAGVFGLAQALRVVVRRGTLMQRVGSGAMVAIWAGQDKARELIADCDLYLAAVNSPMNSVVSGSVASVDQLIEQLKARKIMFTRLSVASAGHSPLLLNMQDEFGEVLADIEFSQPDVALVSGVTGLVAGPEIASAQYWVNQLTATVNFAGGIKSLDSLGVTCFVEVGPQPALSAMAAVCLLGGKHKYIASLRPTKASVLSMWEAAGQLHALGLSLDMRQVLGTPGQLWASLDEEVRQEVLPWAPIAKWHRQLCWFERSAAAAGAATVSSCAKDLGVFALPTCERAAVAAESKVDPQLFWNVTWKPVQMQYDAKPASGTWLWITLGQPSGHYDSLAKYVAQELRLSGQDLSQVTWDNVADYLASDMKVAGVFVAALGADFEPEQCLENTWRCVDIAKQLNSGVGLGTQLVLVTCKAVSVDQQACQPGASAIWAMGRALAVEWPDLGLVRLDVPALAGDEELGKLARFVLAGAGGQEDELAYRHGQVLAPRFGHCDLDTEQLGVVEFRSDREYLVTGGCGGLGLALVDYLVEHGARLVTVVSRQRSVNEHSLAKWQAAGCRLRQIHADAADGAAMRQVIEPLIDQLGGVFHLAGLADVGLLNEQNFARFKRLWMPKAQGAWILHNLTLQAQLEYFVVYSSIGSLLVSPGQSTYAAANGYMDGLMYYRRSLGLPATTVHWALFGDAGMAAEDGREIGRLAATGMRPMLAGSGPEYLGMLLSSQVIDAAVMDFSPSMWLDYYPYWQGSSLMGHLGSSQVVAVSRLWQQIAEADKASGERQLAELIAVAAAECMAYQDWHRVVWNKPYQEMGLDSLMAVEMRGRLEQQLGIGLPVTLVFDYPTVTSSAAFLYERCYRKASLNQSGSSRSALGANQGAPAGARTPTAQASTGTATANNGGHRPSSADVAIIGMAARFPGGCNCLDEYWQFLAEGGDAIADVPRRCFDIAQWYDPDPLAEGKTYCKTAGCLDQLPECDGERWGISAAEAQVMDPHQSLLWNTSLEAIKDSGLEPIRLEGQKLGIYVGQSNIDFALYGINLKHINSFTGTGAMPSVSAGRVAYMLGVNGPAIVLDTACSSALVAVHLACQALRSGDCQMALAGGVNLILSPFSHVFYCKVGSIAPDGRSKAYDAAADGLSRGEGCGMVLLKSLERAWADNDQILAVIKGSAINQDGRSNGLTAPNGPAQVRVIKEALKAAGVSSNQIDYLEGHGTGTLLGDPVELQALGDVFANERRSSSPLWVGSVKSNIGHTEGASGIAGLIKTVLAMRRGALPPSIHYSRPNPYIDMEALRLAVPQQLMEWPLLGAKPLAGVSAFGMSGTNAHVIIEGA